MGKGRRYELDLAASIQENTSDRVHTVISDYSGNARNAFADIEVFFPWDGVDREVLHGAFIEVKNYSGDRGYRETVVKGSSDGEDGRDELERLCESTPSWGKPYLVVNFSNCKPIIYNVHDLLHRLDSDSPTESGPPYFHARLTRGNNLSIRKPTTDEWPTARGSDNDWRVVCERIGVQRADVELTELMESEP